MTRLATLGNLASGVLTSRGDGIVEKPWEVRVPPDGVPRSR